MKLHQHSWIAFICSATAVIIADAINRAIAFCASSGVDSIHLATGHDPVSTTRWNHFFVSPASSRCAGSHSCDQFGISQRRASAAIWWFQARRYGA